MKAMSEVSRSVEHHEQLMAEYAQQQKKMTKEAICERLCRLQFDDGHDIFAVFAKDLHNVVRQNDARNLKYFLDEQGMSPDSQNDHGDTPLAVAALCGFEGMAATLIEHHCSLNKRNNKGWTAMHCAASRNHPKLLKLLFQHGADIHVQDRTGVQPVHLAAQSNSVEALTEIFHLQNDQTEALSVKTTSGMTPAHIAAQFDNLEALRAMHDLGADVEALDVQGDTPAHKAARQCHVRIVEFLQAVGADLNVPNYDDDTAASLMIMAGRYDV